MKYLVIGSGGREHAIAWRLINDGSAREVYVAPGNGGIEERFRVSLDVNDFPGIERFCAGSGIDVVVVGPEAPLAAGIVDYLNGKKIPVFGPSRDAARLEASKIFAKKIMEKNGVNTAGYREFSDKKELVKHVGELTDFPVVIKLDGLAAGKGVSIPESKKEALDFINEMVSDGSRVFIEDYLEGEEASVLGISDGRTILPFVSAQDHKRIFDGDRGPNTGGMGAYAPAPVMNDDRMKEVVGKVLQPVIDGMRNEGTPFRGILYAGLIVTKKEIKVLEFNVRMGDPETQVILPLLEQPLGELIEASIQGTLQGKRITFLNRYAVTVVMSSGGYPGSYEKGKIIRGIDSLSKVLLFHAGTDRRGDDLVTSGGRVLNVTAVGDSFGDARDRVYGEIDKISFEGAFYRKDIGHRAMKYFEK